MWNRDGSFSCKHDKPMLEMPSLITILLHIQFISTELWLIISSVRFSLYSKGRSCYSIVGLCTLPGWEGCRIDISEWQIKHPLVASPPSLRFTFGSLEIHTEDNQHHLLGLLSVVHPIVTRGNSESSLSDPEEPLTLQLNSSLIYFFPKNNF